MGEDSRMFRYLGLQVEIATGAGVITGALLKFKEDKYVLISENTSNLVYVPMEYVEYLRPLLAS